MDVVPRRGEKPSLEISRCDSEGISSSEHNHAEDNNPEKHKGWNVIYSGPGSYNYLRLPIFPAMTEGW